MSMLASKIRQAQQRLWLIRWVDLWTTTVAVAALLFATAIITSRLFGWAMPTMEVMLSLLGASVMASVIWLIATRDSAHKAAVALDEAAGLKERISSGRFCLTDQDDPFAKAVVADAERISAAVTVSQHIRIRVPRQWGLAMFGIMAACMAFLVPEGLLASQKKTTINEQSPEFEQTQFAVKKRMAEVEKSLEENPALADVMSQLSGDGRNPMPKLDRPGDIRNEAVKKIDRMQDAVKEKRNDAKYNNPELAKRALRTLPVPESKDAPTQELAKALAQGDFKAAKEEIEKLKDKLATLKSEEDKEWAKKLGDQLEQMSKQMESLAKNEQLMNKLEQAGVSKEEVERFTENLRKKDLEQIQKQMEQSGMSQQQIQQMTNQLQQMANQQQMAKQMANAMKSASQAKEGQPGSQAMAEAMEGLSQAGEQLSELEQLEQEKQQLESASQQLEDARKEMSDCSKCKSEGKSNCSGGQCKNGQEGQGQGQGQGKGQKGDGTGSEGQGRGGKVPEEQTDVAFKTERQKVKTEKGSIIGTVLVDGEQIPGDASTAYAEVVTAAERDASDAVNRQRIPRHYQKAIRGYFRVFDKKDDGKGGTKEKKSTPEKSDTAPAEVKPSTEKSDD